MDEVEGKEEEGEGKAEVKSGHHHGMICRKRIVEALRTLLCSAVRTRKLVYCL